MIKVSVANATMHNKYNNVSIQGTCRPVDTLFQLLWLARFYDIDSYMYDDVVLLTDVVGRL